MSNDEESGEPIAERSEPPDQAPDGEPGGHPDQAAAEANPERRPMLERIGMAAVAVVMAVLFGVVAVAAFAGGEYFLAAMGFVGCMMTLAVGGATLLRG
jgi:hypothetical protein